jgi:hypothetical protein
MQLLVGGVMAPHGLLMGPMLSATVIAHMTAGLVRVIVILTRGHMQVAVIGVILSPRRVRHQRSHGLLTLLHMTLFKDI